MRSVVQFADANNALRGGEQISRVGAQVTAAVREVTHLARKALFAPTLEPVEIGCRRCGSYTGQLKTAGAGQLFDLDCCNRQTASTAFCFYFDGCHTRRNIQQILDKGESQADFSSPRDRVFFLDAGVERDRRGGWLSIAARKMRLMRVW